MASPAAFSSGALRGGPVGRVRRGAPPQLPYYYMRPRWLRRRPHLLIGSCLSLVGMLGLLYSSSSLRGGGGHGGLGAGGTAMRRGGGGDQQQQLLLMGARQQQGHRKRSTEAGAGPHYRRERLLGLSTPAATQAFANKHHQQHKGAAAAAGSAGASSSSCYRLVRLPPHASEDDKEEQQGGPHHALSSLGLGTYLGEPDDATDALVVEAAVRAVHAGWNVMDTSINYRSQKGERALGRALHRLSLEGVSREAIFLCSKAGFVPADGDSQQGRAAVLHSWEAGGEEEAWAGARREVVQGKHCLHPACLQASLRASLSNLGVASLDVLYLHNAWEVQHPHVGGRSVLLSRLQRAFRYLEQARRQRLIGWYGLATWSCFRSPPGSPAFLSLQQVVRLAQAAYEEEHAASHHSSSSSSHRHHGLRFVQLPLNPDMLEAASEAWQPLEEGGPVTLLQAAAALGVVVVSSRSINAMGGPGPSLPPACPLSREPDSAQQRLQLTRSIQGLTTALVGMKAPAHVSDNLPLQKEAALLPGQLALCLPAAAAAAAAS